MRYQNIMNTKKIERILKFLKRQFLKIEIHLNTNI